MSNNFNTIHTKMSPLIFQSACSISQFEISYLRTSNQAVQTFTMENIWFSHLFFCYFLDFIYFFFIFPSLSFFFTFSPTVRHVVGYQYLRVINVWSYCGVGECNKLVILVTWGSTVVFRRSWGVDVVQLASSVEFSLLAPSDFKECRRLVSTGVYFL